MSYNGSGTFVINSTGQPVVTGTVISSSTFNSLTADLGTGLSTAITKDGQTTTTVKIPFAQGISAAVASNFAAGTVGAPSIYLSTDTTTGLYRIGANNDGFAISGVKLLDLSSALVGITGALTVSTTMGVTGTTTSARINSTILTESVGLAWTAYTPTISADTGSWGAPTITLARYRILGKTLWANYLISATVASGAPTEMRVLFPESASGQNAAQRNVIQVSNNGISEFGGVALSTTSTYFIVYRPGGVAYTTSGQFLGAVTWELS